MKKPFLQQDRRIMLCLFSVFHFEKTFRKLNNVLRKLCLYQHSLIYFTIWVLVINILFVSAVTSKKEKWIKQKMKRPTTSITQNLEIKKLDWLFSSFVLLSGDVRRHGHQSFKPVRRLMSYKLNLNFPCGWLIIKNDDKGALQKAIS